MFLEQICPGQVNSHLHAIHTFIYKNDRYIIYATGSKIVIYADPDNLIQIIAASSLFKKRGDLDPISAVAGNSNTGQIAVSYFTQIAILNATETQGGIRWTLSSILDTLSSITCLDWSVHNLLLSAGSEILLWECDADTNDWKKLCSKKPATDISLAKFEPKSNVFATLGKFDRLVTVWYPNYSAESGVIDYSFTFISHPKYVTHFVWRRLPPKSKENDCTLFTMARDGIGRFWSPTNLEHPQQLYMCAVIDSNQSLVTSEVKESAHQLIHPEHAGDDQTDDDFSPIHYIGCDELSDAVNAKFRSYSKQNRLDQRVERIKDRIKDTPDLLFRIQSDGSLTFWGVQNLNSSPRRVPRVFVVLRVDNALDPLDTIYFLKPTHILHDFSHIQSSSIIKPVELSLIARNPHGQIRCYSLNLVDFLDSTSFAPKLHLKYTWLGHQHSICKLYQTQKNRFSTIGIDGQINVWKYELRETCGKMTTQLQLDCSLFVNSETVLAVPIDKGGNQIEKYLAVYDGKHVKVYEFDKKDCHLYHSKMCESNTDLIQDLSSLHVYNMDDASNGERAFLLIGVSKTLNQISTWYLIPHHHGMNIKYCGTTKMSWSVSPVVVTSASQWATNTASRLFHSLHLHQKIVLTVALETEIVFYTVDVREENVEWNVLYTLNTSDSVSSIQKIRCAPNSLAVVSGEDRKTLSIWMEMRSDVPPECMKTIRFEEPICDLAWNITSDAQFLLAIAFPNHVSIFGQKRTSYTADENDFWICYTDFKVDTPEDITALAWVDCGVLTVAAGNQIRCYLKWLTDKDSIENSIQDTLHSELEPMSSIFDISYEMNGPLPFYHPNHLIHYIMWGKMDLVNNVLLSLSSFFKQFVDEEDKIINEFPPVSVAKMLKLQNGNKRDNQREYNGLFDGDDDDYTKDFDSEDSDNVRPITQNEAKNLAHYLKLKALPGLSINERIHLIAMVDTIVEITHQGESLDENGARFTALLENHFHLNASLPENQRQLELKSREFIWAFHSQSQDLLLERCVRLCDNKLLWEDARNLGIFVWLQKIDVVRDQMANIARNIYLSKPDYRDPVDCTLFYLALRKKNLLQGLWNTATYHKEQSVMKKFLANDFNEPRWKTAASKNAFALLGKQRFEYAAAFFLLADKLRDAVNVILKNLKDFHLAIAVCRVYEGDHSNLLKEILETTVIPQAIASNDRWMVSMALWLLSRQRDAVRSIVVPLSQFSVNGLDTTAADSVANVQDPNAFILYHDLKNKLLKDQTTIVPYHIEYNFSLLVSRAYERLGCPLLSLYILTKYYMKPPTAEKNDKKVIKADKAEDLFASAEPAPSYAADIFSDEPPQKPSYAEDLFADIDNDLFAKPSNTNSLFDDDNDLFADTKSNSKGLFDEEEDDLFGKTKGASEQSSNEEEDDLSTKEPDGLDAYKAMLIIRLLQIFFHAASALYNCLEQPDNVYESKYRNHFVRNRQALIDLGESVKIPPSIFSKLLMEKSIETDVFPLYLHILNEGIPKDFDVHRFLRSFKVGCFEVNEVAYMPEELDYTTLAFVENWTIHVMKTFSIWSSLRQKYCNPETEALTTREIILTTYISLILITIKERQYERCWSLIFHLKAFLESIGADKNDTSITDCLNQALKNDTKMIDMLPDDFDSFSDGSLFGYDMNEETYRPLIDSQDKSAGANILEIASLNYLLSCIEYAMQSQGKHAGLNEQLSNFIWTTLLDPIAFRVHQLKISIAKQSEDDLSKHNMMKQFKTLRQKKYWRSIKSLSTFDRLLPFVNASSPTVNVISDDQLDHIHTVYHSATTAYALCLSPTSQDVVAVCLKNEIQEIDLSKTGNTMGSPLVRVRTASSSGLSQEHPLDSYPDTEEEGDSSDNDHESVNTHTAANKQPTSRKQFPISSSSRVSGASTPLISPAGGKTCDEHVQKVPQSLNIEHLQDSLRKTLSKSHDTVRTPVAASPVPMDNNEREKMITLRRPVSVSCAETHPQYPFYITGCDTNHGGPSAILWQFGQDREIATYYGCQGKPTRIHFDHYGQKFGAGDTSGNLCLWRFDSHAHSNKPYYAVNCHSKATRDFTFINSSSLIATAGTSLAMSRKRDYVCLWDSLLPPSKALVCALPGHESGAYAIVYEPENQLLFSGGKRGEIVVSDLRQRTTMHTFTAHQSRIRSIAIDAENKTLITGSIDGELKLWDVNTYKLRQSYDIQPRNRFLAPTFNRIPLKAFGVTQIQIVKNDSNIYTSGPNGIMKCSRVFPNVIR